MAPTKKTEFAALDGFADDDHKAALDAFVVGANDERIYKTRQMGVDSRTLKMLAREAEGIQTKQDALKYWGQNFDVFSVEEDGFLTGFYEPVLPASLERTDRFNVPLYCQPPECPNPNQLNESPNFLDRKAINEGALEGRGLELAWLDNPVDAYFVHIQGSAKLLLEGGGVMRVTFATKSGHEYVSLGKVLSEQLGIPSSQMTADLLRTKMEEMRESNQLDPFLAQNPSYIFFGESKPLRDDEGPIAAAKVPLVAGRSLAVDRKWHTFGSLIWVAPDSPDEHDWLPRLVVAHDTGSAIIGPARGDLFVGSGEEAGIAAGRIQTRARFFLVAPKKGIVRKVSDEHG